MIDGRLSEIVLVLGFPVVAMIWGRIAWAVFCARTRRAACRMFQFRLRDLMILSLTVSLIGGAYSCLQKIRPSWLILLLRGLLEGDWRRYYWWYGCCCDRGFPEIFFLAAGMPLGLLLWQSIGEWFSDRWRKKPPAKPVSFTWLRSACLASDDSSSESLLTASPSAQWMVNVCDFAGVPSESAGAYCQLLFTYEAVPACWPNAASHVGSPGQATAASILVAIPAMAGDSLSQKEWIDYGNEF